MGLYGLAVLVLGILLGSTYATVRRIEKTYFLTGTYFTSQHSLEELRKIVKVLEELKRDVE